VSQSLSCPYLLFIEQNSFIIVMPDFQALSVRAQTLDHAIELAQTALIEKIRGINARQQSLPKISRREDYINQYLNAVLVSTLSIDLETL
jgi:hypothetical protein